MQSISIDGSQAENPSVTRSYRIQIIPELSRCAQKRINRFIVMISYASAAREQRTLGLCEVRSEPLVFVGVPWLRSLASKHIPPTVEKVKWNGVT